MKHGRASFWLHAIFLSVGIAGCGNGPGGSSTVGETPSASVVVYAPDSANSLESLLHEFESATGISYSIVQADAADPVSRADVYFGESFVGLWEMAEADLLRPVDLSLEEQVAAAELTDPERRYVPLSALIRGIVCKRHLVSAEEIHSITGFSELADDRRKGRLCLSSSALDGNRLLVAHLIRQHGVREAEIIVRGWLANPTEGIFDNDAALLLAIENGRCALGVLDFGWIGRSGWPEAVVPYPAINCPLLLDVRGAGISRHAGNPEAARQLLEWLLSARGNSVYARDWQQAPLSREIVFDPHNEFSWRAFVDVAGSLAELGFLLEEADLLIERAGYR